MLTALEGEVGRERHAEPVDKLACLSALERKVLWLSTWMIHNANHLRPNRDGLKVGGHQASSASAATLMTALYLDVMRPQDRVAVKPHASPIFHALQYLLGQQIRPDGGFDVVGPGDGAIPETAIHRNIRIDYVQHVCSAMIRASEWIDGTDPVAR